jgi:hypothetical protein
MKIEVKITDADKLKKENILSDIDKHVKCYLKHSKWLRWGDSAICENNLEDVFKAGSEMTNEQYCRIKDVIPYAYMYIDPDNDESWINNWHIFSIMRNFNLVVIKTYRMTKPAVDQLIKNINACQPIFDTPYDRVSNIFDYEYIVLAANYDNIVEHNIFKLDE